MNAWNKLLFRLNYWYSGHWIKKHNSDKWDYRENSKIHHILMSLMKWENVPGRHVIRKAEAMQRRKNAEYKRLAAFGVTECIAAVGGIVLFGMVCFLFLIGG